ncbi:MAG: hypothetical protein N2489_09085 [Clostridia bacterium]|nr:hypothetical protein [Clostridia bacterium]
MFFKKSSKKTANIIILHGENGEKIYEGAFSALSLRESLILNKCIEYFNDQNPCFIHRSASVNRILFELEEGLKALSSGQNTSYKWDELEDGFKNILYGEKPIAAVSVKWNEQI